MIGCRRDARQERGLLTQGPVRPVSVVVGDVLGQDAFEVATTEDQRSVEALTADGADEAFGERRESSRWRAAVGCNGCGVRCTQTLCAQLEPVIACCRQEPVEETPQHAIATSRPR